MRRLALLLVLAGCVATTKDPVEKRSPREDALAELEARPSNYDNEWHAAEVCQELADEAVEHLSSSRRLELAKRGIAHANRAIKLKADGVEGHYYKCLNVGRYLELTKPPKPIEVADLRDEGELTARLDEHFECSGAHRFLGYFYWQTPDQGPWGYGDVAKADRHFLRALAVAGDCPENHLAYAHFQLEKMDNKDGARDAAKRALELIDKHPPLSPAQRAELRKDAEGLLKDCE